MRSALSSGILSLTFAVGGFSQADTVKPGEVRVSALAQTAVGETRSLAGQVRIETATVIITAEQAFYNPKTGDVQASGNVHINLKK